MNKWPTLGLSESEREQSFAFLMLICGGPTCRVFKQAGGELLLCLRSESRFVAKESLLTFSILMF